MKRALVIGGGFAGCAAAHQINLLGGWDVTLVEAAPHLGGGVRTMFYGGHPYTFGPRHFLTKNEAVFAYLHDLLPMRRCEHEFITYVEKDAAFYGYPIHRDDLPRMPEWPQIQGELQELRGVEGARNLEEYWIGSVGQTLYEKFVKSYSRKMWDLEAHEIDDFGWSPKGVALKEGPRAAWSEAISAYPLAHDGYNNYFKIATDGARVLLNTKISKYNIPDLSVHFNNAWHVFDVIVSTISPDLLFEQCHGKLPYIGRDIYPIVLPVEHAFPENVYFVYYAGGEKFTRIVEYKKFTQHKSPHTLIGLEIPSKNGRYYPLPVKHYYDLADAYFEMLPELAFSIGRAGSYRYSVDIDDSIEQAMLVAKCLK
jgi:UDP-galactopyranose mutase